MSIPIKRNTELKGLGTNSPTYFASSSVTKGESFISFTPEVSIPYEPRSMSWCKDSVCVAFVGGYSLIKLNRSGQSDGGICELFSAGVKNEKQNSSVTLLADERFALVEDRTTKLVDLVNLY